MVGILAAAEHLCNQLRARLQAVAANKSPAQLQAVSNQLAELDHQFLEVTPGLLRCGSLDADVSSQHASSVQALEDAVDHLVARIKSAIRASGSAEAAEQVLGACTSVLGVSGLSYQPLDTPAARQQLRVLALWNNTPQALPGELQQELGLLKEEKHLKDALQAASSISRMQCVVPEAKLVSLCNQGRDSLRVHLLHAQFTNGPASYNIIHFGGHCRDGCLVFGGPADPEALSLDVFAELVLAYCPDVKAVLLNGCGGTQQEAERALHALLEAEIPVVVAVGRLKDQCAQRFARGFFDAIFIGKNASEAVEEGRRAMRTHLAKREIEAWGNFVLLNGAGDTGSIHNGSSSNGTCDSDCLASQAASMSSKSSVDSLSSSTSQLLTAVLSQDLLHTACSGTGRCLATGHGSNANGAETGGWTHEPCCDQPAPSHSANSLEACMDWEARLAEAEICSRFSQFIQAPDTQYASVVECSSWAGLAAHHDGPDMQGRSHPFSFPGTPAGYMQQSRSSTPGSLAASMQAIALTNDSGQSPPSARLLHGIPSGDSLLVSDLTAEDEHASSPSSAVQQPLPPADEGLGQRLLHFLQQHRGKEFTAQQLKVKLVADSKTAVNSALCPLVALEQVTRIEMMGDAPCFTASDGSGKRVSLRESILWIMQRDGEALSAKAMRKLLDADSVTPIRSVLHQMELAGDIERVMQLNASKPFYVLKAA